MQTREEIILKLFKEEKITMEECKILLPQTIINNTYINNSLQEKSKNDFFEYPYLRYTNSIRYSGNSN